MSLSGCFQATLLNLLLRNYLAYSLYDQAICAAAKSRSLQHNTDVQHRRATLPQPRRGLLCARPQDPAFAGIEVGLKNQLSGEPPQHAAGISSGIS